MLRGWALELSSRDANIEKAREVTFPNVML